MRVKIGAVIIALTMVFSLASRSANRADAGRSVAQLKLNPDNTRIVFILKGSVHNTEGSFKLKHGELMVEPDIGKVDGSIVVDAASGQTGIVMRDERMRDSILEAQRYPEISFNPYHAEGHPVAHGTFTERVSGTFLLHGDRHDATLEVAINRNGDDFTATARFEIPYVVWGLKDPSVMFLRVDRKVQVEVSTAGRVTWIPAAIVPAQLSNQPH
jgi:polyisoprenoid-binding protein YceI